jgi:transposase
MPEAPGLFRDFPKEKHNALTLNRLSVRVGTPTALGNKTGELSSSQKLRMLLTHRKLLQSKAIAIENDLRGTLRNFGLKVGMVGKVRFEARIEELVENFPDLAVLVEPLLIVRRAHANRSLCCAAACWPSCETMRCAGA